MTGPLIIGAQSLRVSEFRSRMLDRWGTLAEPLWPIELLGGDIFACELRLERSNPVVLWNPLRPLHEQDFRPVAADVDAWSKIRDTDSICAAKLIRGWLHATRQGPEWQTASLRSFLETVAAFHAAVEPYSHRSKRKLPRSDDWRPIRHCFRDGVIGLLSLRHDRRDGALHVRAYITSDHEDLESGAATRSLTELMLGEAFRSGGTMAIQFDSQRGPARLPPDLQSLLILFDLTPLPDTSSLSPADSRSLFAKLVGFSPAMHLALGSVEATAALSLEHACYLVASGIWPKAELEAALIGSPLIACLLAGAIRLHDRGAFAPLLAALRPVLLAGFGVRQLGLVGLDAFEELAPPDNGAPDRRFRATASAHLPFDEQELAVATGQVVVLTPLVRKARRTFVDDAIHIIAVPSDVRTADREGWNNWVEEERLNGVRIMACDASLADVDLEVLARLERASRVRP